MECIVMEQRDFMGARTVDLIPLATPLAPIVGDHKLLFPGGLYSSSKMSFGHLVYFEDIFQLSHSPQRTHTLDPVLLSLGYNFLHFIFL